MVYFFMMLFLGMISGFAFGSEIIGYIGVFGASTCLIIAVVQSFDKMRVYKNIEGLKCRSKKIESIIKIYERMSNLRTDIEEEFTIEEIISEWVDFSKASVELNSIEYMAVRKLNDKIVQQIKIRKLNIFEHRKLSLYIVALFDMVAPFYKFSIDDDVPTKIYMESSKERYRDEARQLLFMDKLFSSEWNDLFEKFCDNYLIG